jgi:hypothetical protein
MDEPIFMPSLFALGAREVEDDLFGLLRFQVHGAMGMEQLVGEVAEDASAARRNAAPGDLNDEAGEEFLDVLAVREVGGFGQEVGGEVFGVTGSCGKDGSELFAEVSEAETGLKVRAAKAALGAIGITMLVTGGVCRGVGCGGGCGFRIVGFQAQDFDAWAKRGHDFLTFLEAGVHTHPHCCKDLKTKGLKITDAAHCW